MPILHTVYFRLRDDAESAELEAHLKSRVIDHDQSSWLLPRAVDGSRAVRDMLIHVTQPWNSKLVLAFGLLIGACTVLSA